MGPQALPECLKGQALFPTITYKNVTLQVHFGPTCLTSLPFKCRMLADAAKEDLEIVKASAVQSEVVFPVGLPDQGLFDWVDRFLEKHPGFNEISERKIIEWAIKSGNAVSKRDKELTSNDSPYAKFGVPSLDDGSIRQVLSTIAAVSHRNCIIPTLKANLVADERIGALAKFGLPGVRKKAVVIMGEPDSDYKDAMNAITLAAKQQKAEEDKKKNAKDEERKRKLEERKKIAEEAKRKREERNRLQKEGA